jgi:serine O-acetyltransferase
MTDQLWDHASSADPIVAEMRAAAALSFTPDTKSTFTELVMSDLQRYRPGIESSWLKFLARCPFTPGLIVSLLLRAQQRIYLRGHVRFAFLLRTIMVMLFNCEFVPELIIGRGLYMPHPLGIAMGVRAWIGENVTILQGTTIGGAAKADGRGGRHGVTIVDDGASISPHAFIRTGVRVGKNAEVGVNSVVLKDVADNAVVAGMPARQIGTREPADEPSAPTGRY